MVTIEGVRVFTGTGLSEPTTVHVHDGAIAERSAGGTRIDGAGRVLLPGLIDAHVHVVRGRDDLRELTEWGVTTGLDMACWPIGLVQAMRAETGVADFRSATIPAVGPGGNHARLPGFPAEGIVTTPGQARAFVERRMADNADYIKIVTEAAPPAGMDRATVAAIVQAAHEHGLKVVAHSVTTGAVDLAVEAGVDIITHAPLDAVLDDKVITRMVRAGMVSVPTLTMMEGVVRAARGRGPRYEPSRDTVAALHRAGVPILAGTDANAAPGAPAAVRHGESLHHELELLVDAGLTPIEALRGATCLPAATFGLTDRGAIAPGKRADLVLVDGDPTADITATRAIAGVWIEGERVR